MLVNLHSISDTPVLAGAPYFVLCFHLLLAPAPALTFRGSKGCAGGNGEAARHGNSAGGTVSVRALRSNFCVGSAQGCPQVKTKVRPAFIFIPLNLHRQPQYFIHAAWPRVKPMFCRCLRASVMCLFLCSCCKAGVLVFCRLFLGGGTRFAGFDFQTAPACTRPCFC